MTCAGIASLVIAGDVLHEPDAKVSGDQIDGCYRAPSEDQDRIDRGIDWLRRALHRPGQSARRRPPAAASGITIISTGWSGPDGSPRGARSASTIGIAKGPPTWSRPSAPSSREVRGKAAAYAEDNEDIATSLALLFLSKGRWPVLMAKVQYRSPQPGRWGRTSIGIATATTSTT